MRFLPIALLAVLLCVGRGPKGGAVEDLKTRLVILPDGREIRAEVLIQPSEMARGMMYREPLPQGRGLLFIV